MHETTFFILLTFTAALISFGFIVGNRSVQRSDHLASGFYSFCFAMASALAISTALSVSGSLPIKGTFAFIFRILVFKACVVIGVAISTTVLVLVNSTRTHVGRLKTDAVRVFVISPYVLKGLCLSVAVAFLATEAGKLAHDVEMRQFFLESGYAVWFLYLVIAAETLGSIALLVSRLIVPAAIGLAILMIGAIYTHCNNGDPISDSLEAIHLLILLIGIIVIKSLRPKVPATIVAA